MKRKSDTDLMFAINAGTCADVESIVDDGVSPNHEYDWGYPIFRACDLGRHDIIQKLVELGTDVNVTSLARDATPLGAIMEGNVHLTDDEVPGVVELLLELGANTEIYCGGLRDRRTPLQLAILHKRIRAALVLLMHGACINTKDHVGNDAIDYAVQFEATDVLSWIESNLNVDVKARVEKAAKAKALIDAIKEGREKDVSRLLDDGVDANSVNVFKLDALFCAADQGSLKLTRQLLEAGANPNNLEGENTALMAAAYHGSHEVFDELLNAEANIFAGLEVAPGVFMDCLQFACEGGHKVLAAHIKDEMNSRR